MRAISPPAEQPVSPSFASAAHAASASLRARLRSALPGLEPRLHVIAEGLPARDGPIDLLAHTEGGELVVVLVAPCEGPNEAARLLTRAIATRDWLASELPGWLQLLPAVDVGPDTRVRCLLLARSFDETTRAATRALPTGWIELAIYRPFVHAGDHYLLLEHDPEMRRDPPPTNALQPADQNPRVIETGGEPMLRSGLSDADFKLSRAERRSLAPGGSPRPRYSVDEPSQRRSHPLGE